MTVQPYEPGFWDCCQAKPTKIVAFDGEHGELIWHYACAGCASTVHPSRVQDAPTHTLLEFSAVDSTFDSAYAALKYCPECGKPIDINRVSGWKACFLHGDFEPARGATAIEWRYTRNLIKREGA